MAKVHSVIELLTAKACLSRGLAKHFDDEDSMPKEGCGRFSFCLSGKSIPLHQTDTHSRKGRIDKTKSGAILAATKVRNDARFLARVLKPHLQLPKSGTTHASQPEPLWNFGGARLTKLTLAPAKDVSIKPSLKPYLQLPKLRTTHAS